MHLNDLLAIEGSPLEPSSICLMRHTDRELGDYLHDPPILSFYTSVQKRGKLDRYKYAMAFVASSSGKTVFRGMYQILDRSPLLPDHYSSLFLPDAIIRHYDTLCYLDEYDYYTVSASPHLSAYSGRVVVDWGGAHIVWFQSFSATNPKEILEILPTGFFRPFESYSSVSLARSELEFLFKYSDSNPEWVGHLSRVAGIYLILDEGSGDQYIGSASGGKGIWGRWSDYFEDPSGGNALLRQRLNAVPEAYRRFRYSLLEALPGNTVTAEVVAKENLYKKMLGTRAHGLNLN
jgi:hypothetical protein